MCHVSLYYLYTPNYLVLHNEYLTQKVSCNMVNDLPSAFDELISHLWYSIQIGWMWVMSANLFYGLNIISNICLIKASSLCKYNTHCFHNITAKIQFCSWMRSPSIFVLFMIIPLYCKLASKGDEVHIMFPHTKRRLASLQFERLGPNLTKDSMD